MKDEKYLRTKEAAAILNASPSKLNKMRLTGDGPLFFRIGRSVRYRLSELHRWMDNNAASRTARR
jgi:excisionase family DNA binding protein